MSEESDWELVSDSEPNEWSEKVHVELPTDGVLPNQTDSESKNVASSSTNSFSVIQGINELGVQSLTGSPISSFAQPSSNESLVGSSICGQFDLVSLSSGEVCFRCKRCQARNPIGTGICKTCGLAQVANPCIDMDNQLALAQQQREEMMALEALKFDESQLQNLMSDTLLNKATYLTQKLMAQVEPRKSLLQDDAEMDFVNRTHTFLSKAYGLLQGGSVPRTNLNLVCGYVMMEQREGAHLRLHGFRRDRNVRVNRTMECASKHFYRSTQKISPSASLSSISENDALKRPPAFMWIVAVVGTQIRFHGLAKNVTVRGDRILPLVHFDAKTIDTHAGEIDSLADVLLQVIDDTFVDGLHLKDKHIARALQQTNPADFIESSFKPKRRHKKCGPDQRWRSEQDSPPKAARRSTAQDVRVQPNSEGIDSITRIDQKKIDENLDNRFGTLSSFCGGVSMKDLAGLEHDTRTSLRFYNVPASNTPDSLLNEFTHYGFPAARFNLFFLFTRPGYRPSILFLDFADYRDIPEFCRLFCSRNSDSSFQFQPQYTNNQGKAALNAYFATSPLEYDPIKFEA